MSSGMRVRSQWQHVRNPDFTLSRIHLVQNLCPQGSVSKSRPDKSKAHAPEHSFSFSSSHFFFLSSSALFSTRFLFRISLWQRGHRRDWQCIRWLQFEHFFPWTNGVGRWCNSRANINFSTTSLLPILFSIFNLFNKSNKYNGEDCSVIVACAVPFN